MASPSSTTFDDSPRTISELAQILRDTRRMCRAFLAMHLIESDTPEIPEEIPENPSIPAPRLSDIWN